MNARGQWTLSLGHTAAPAEILVGDCNREALRQIFAAPARTVYLEGPAASGKSLIAKHWAAKFQAEILSAAALDLEAAARLASDGAAAIDGLEGLVGSEREEALFHLSNALTRQGGRLFLTARSPPRALTVALPDLRTRLNAMPLARIALPDEPFLYRLVLHLAERRQLVIPEPVAEFLVARMGRSQAAALNLVEALDRLSLESGRKVTRELAAAALSAVTD
jgi:chromosomal replication initiation ATPase DnaA